MDNEAITTKKRTQVRCVYSDNMIHVQGVGTEMNRPYGMATEFRVPTVITNWLKGQNPTLQSPASGDTLYIPVQLIQYTGIESAEIDGCSEVRRWQLVIESTVDGGDPLNHPKGAVLDMQPLSIPVSTFIEFCTMNELCEEGEGEPYTGDEKDEC